MKRMFGGFSGVYPVPNHGLHATERVICKQMMKFVAAGTLCSQTALRALLIAPLIKTSFKFVDDDDDDLGRQINDM